VTVTVRLAGRVVGVATAGRVAVVAGRVVVVVDGSFGGGAVVSGLAGGAGAVVVVSNEGEPVVSTVPAELVVMVVSAPSPADATVVGEGVPPHAGRAAIAISAATRSLFTLPHRHRPGPG
jgi:hypothetical protein